jgi:hypothetical protein
MARTVQRTCTLMDGYSRDAGHSAGRRTQRLLKGSAGTGYSRGTQGMMGKQRVLGTQGVLKGCWVYSGYWVLKGSTSGSRSRTTTYLKCDDIPPWLIPASFRAYANPSERPRPPSDSTSRAHGTRANFCVLVAAAGPTGRGIRLSAPQSCSAPCGHRTGPAALGNRWGCHHPVRRAQRLRFSELRMVCSVEG